MSGYRVDVHAADRWVERLQTRLTQSDRLLSGVGDYAAVYSIDETRALALSCDGVGTKLLWTLDGWGTPEDLAQDLVAMNTNDLICVGAKPTLFLDYLAVSHKNLLEPGATLDRFMSGLITSCETTGCLLVGGETAQLPDLYQPGHFDLAGFAVGFLDRRDWLNVNRIQPGFEVWALSSRGPHSNGFTLLRELFDLKGQDSRWAADLMAPTALYPALSGLPGVEAAFHITGSGWMNLLRAQPKGRSVGFQIDWDESCWPAWAVEAVRRAGLSLPSAYETFNMGLGLMIVCSDSTALRSRPEFLSHGLKRVGVTTAEASVRVNGIRLV
jgi:phosphoribosylformylglycinamidine cyclo-ligase